MLLKLREEALDLGFGTYGTALIIGNFIELLSSIAANGLAF